MKKSIAAVFFAALLAFFAPSAANADPSDYVAPPQDTTVSAATVVPGGVVVFAYVGGEFAPGETINISVTLQTAANASGAAGSAGAAAVIGGPIAPTEVVKTLATEANAEGNFSVEIPMPETEGTYLLTATGAQTGFTATAAVTVDAAAAGDAVVVEDDDASATSGLADTGVGGSTILWSIIGVAIVALGVVSLVVARRRQGSAA